MSDERFIEIGQKVATMPGYKNPSDRGSDLFKAIKEMLPPEGQKLMFELEECYSAEEATAVEVYYNKGFKDGFAQVLSILLE